MEDNFVFIGTVNNVKTMASDNGVRVTLDLPEDAIDTMAMLAETKRAGLVLRFTVEVAG